MKHGPYLFLGLLLAMSLSWLGMVATPQLQFGSQQPTNVGPANIIYPIPYSGLASYGRDVYRANGCAYCHTQVIRQDIPRFDVVLSSPGTNQTAVAQAIRQFRPNLSPADVEHLFGAAPATVLTESAKAVADAAQKAIADAAGEASVRVVPTGPDIARGWGARLSVAPDYLYRTPLLLGTVRLRPDLTNIGLRRPDPHWHLIHLYNPKLEVPGSTMPRYPFLFETRKSGGRKSPDSLAIPGDLEVVPTQEARALAAYLTNLKTELPLFEAPGPQVPSPPPAAGDTNQTATASGGTNAPAGGQATNTPAAGQATNSPTATPTAPQ